MSLRLRRRAAPRRDALAAEIAKLDDFVCIAEALLKHSRLESSKASATEDEKAAGGKDAEVEREDLSARELKAGERVGKPRTTHNEPAPDRKRGLSLKQQLERWSSP